MAKVNIKEIITRVSKMLDAWRQGARDVKFMSISQPDLQADYDAVQTELQGIADAEASVKLRKVAVAAKAAELQKKSVKVREGVEGDSNFGSDSPLYAAMGFVIDSLRKSGLTRKKDTPSV